MELAGESMSDKILLGLQFVFVKGFFKNDFEIGRGCRRCGVLRARSERLTHVEDMA